MFSYEENENVVNKAIMKCLNERFEFGGFDEPETFTGNTTGGMSIKQGYEIPKRVLIKLEVTSKDKLRVVGNVSLKDPKTGKPITFEGVGFERIGDFNEDSIGYSWYAEFPELKGGWALNCEDNVDNYELSNIIEEVRDINDESDVIRVLTKLVQKGAVSLSNPFFKK